MINHSIQRIFTVLIIGTAGVVSAYADDVAKQGRAILAKNREAVVTIELVLKQTISYSGSGSQEMETKSEATGTVLNADGLTVMSLSQVDPSALLEAMTAGTPQSSIKMDTEIQDVKILMTDGTQIPAEVILRDRDLDMAFIRPLKKPETPFVHVDLENIGVPLQMDQVISLNKLGKVARRAHSASVERIDAIVTKPRTFYVPGKDPTNTGLGSPAFTLEGKFIGVFFIRAIKATGGGMNSMFGGGQDNITSILLPAIDIQDALAQAPSFE